MKAKLRYIKNKLLNPTFFLLNDLYSDVSSFLPIASLKKPLVLKIRITNRCNLTCPFCYLKTGLNRPEKDVLSIDEWRKIFEGLPKHTILDITGAEPLAAEKFGEFLILIKEFGFRFSITTNGTLYNKETIPNLVKNGLQVLMVSLDGLEETHNKLRGKKNAFKRTTEFLELVTSYKAVNKVKKPVVNIKITVLDDNHSEILPLIKRMNECYDVDLFTLTFLFQNRARGGMELLESYESLHELSGNKAYYSNPEAIVRTISNIEKFKEENSLNIVYKPRMSFKEVKNYIRNPGAMGVKQCPQYKNNLTLYFNGDLTPCDIGLKVSNIRELNYDFRNIIKLKNVLSFKQRMAQEEFNPMCDGCCAGSHKFK